MSEYSELAREINDRYQYCRDNGHLTYMEKANTCEDYFAGIQWDPIIKRRLERQGKPVLTINKTLATLATVFGEQLENRADISFQPAKHGMPEVAEALTKVYIQVAHNNKLDWVESNVADDGFVTSRGFYDVRVEFDDHMQGEVRICSLNPRNVIIDPDAESYDPDQWKEVFVTKWLTVNDIELLYGKGKASKVKDNMTDSYDYGYDFIERSHSTYGGFIIPADQMSVDTKYTRLRVVERQYKKLRNAWHFVDLSTGDTRVVPDNWDQAKRVKVANATGVGLVRKMVEQIRWTVVCGNTVLFDEWSPYKHFTVVPYFPFFRHGRTIGIVENLLSPQDVLNKVSSQELHIVNTTANSGWKVKKGSLGNMDIEDLEERGAETGLVMELEDVKDAEKITPNQVPTGLDRVSYKADEHIKEISGVSDSKRGFDRADVAAKAIQAKQAAGSVNLAKPLDNLARTRHLLAERVLSLVQTYYTEERVLQITGRGPMRQNEELVINQMTPEGMIVNDLTLGEYSVVVTTVPARNTFEETQFQEAIQLRELGIPIPDHWLIENSRLAHKAEIVKEMAESDGGEQEALQQQLTQLEIQLKTAEVKERLANAGLQEANAALSAVRAKQTAIEAMKGEQDEELSEREKAMMDIQLQREKAAADIQLQRERLQAEIELKRQEMAADFELKKQDQAAKNRIQLLDKARQARQQQQKPPAEGSAA